MNDITFRYIFSILFGLTIVLSLIFFLILLKKLKEAKENSSIYYWEERHSPKYSLGTMVPASGYDNEENFGLVIDIKFRPEESRWENINGADSYVIYPSTWIYKVAYKIKVQPFTDEPYINYFEERVLDDWKDKLLPYDPHK